MRFAFCSRNLKLELGSVVCVVIPKKMNDWVGADCLSQLPLYRVIEAPSIPLPNFAAVEI